LSGWPPEIIVIYKNFRAGINPLQEKLILKSSGGVYPRPQAAGCRIRPFSKGSNNDLTIIFTASIQNKDNYPKIEERRPIMTKQS
jgi:hypothetical protein